MLPHRKHFDIYLSGKATTFHLACVADIFQYGAALAEVSGEMSLRETFRRL